jgi:hypothetical protein
VHADGGSRTGRGGAADHRAALARLGTAGVRRRVRRPQRSDEG